MIVSTELSHSLQVVLHGVLVTHMHCELWRAANNNHEATSIENLSVAVFALPPLEAHD